MNTTTTTLKHHNMVPNVCEALIIIATDDLIVVIHTRLVCQLLPNYYH